MYELNTYLSVTLVNQYVSVCHTVYEFLYTARQIKN